MTHWVSLALVLVLLPSCAAQEARTVDASWTASILGAILNRAHTSGSLIYSGKCENNGGGFDLPSLRLPSDRKTPTLQMLREMFAGDPKMQVMQEPNGTIRMMESDVPRDLLDFRIMYISFDTEHGGLDSPVFALWEILAQPELKTFMVEKKLGPTLPDSFRFSVPASDVRISGELYYVTVSQALDYILKTFPGFWAYETCENGDRGRTVYLNFFPTVPPSVTKFP